MELFRQIQLKMGTNALLTIIIGVFFIVNPQGTTALIAAVAGAVILVWGIIDIIRYFLAGGYGLIFGSLTSGVIKCVIGVFMLLHTNIVITLLSYLISILIIVSGVNCMEGAMQLRRGRVSNWGINALLGLAFIVIGVLMIIFPLDVASSVMVIVGVILVADGLSGIFTAHRLRKVRDKINRDMF